MLPKHNYINILLHNGYVNAIVNIITLYYVKINTLYEYN